MKRILIAIVSIVLVLGALFVGYKILSTKPPAPVDEHGHGGGHDEHEEEVVKGPNGGRLFGEKDFQTEVTIYEPARLEPKFRIYFFANEKPLDPAGIELTLELHRINRIDIITFEKQGMFLAGQQPAVEPHSFDAKIEAKRGGKTITGATRVSKAGSR